VTSYACIATGEMDVVSDTVPRLTGHPAQTLTEYLAANPGS
jgi:NAD(P)H dehydrogenase (quinone)